MLICCGSVSLIVVVLQEKYCIIHIVKPLGPLEQRWDLFGLLDRVIEPTKTKAT